MQDYVRQEEIEPGIIQTMDSKYLDKILIKFTPGLKEIGNGYG
jgi:hypothetical protein